jgi:hypothetical protein
MYCCTCAKTKLCHRVVRQTHSMFIPMLHLAQSVKTVAKACTIIAAYLSMRDSATSAMRGWEHWKPDGFASWLFLDQLILLESWI